MFNKKIASELAVGIVLILAITIGGIVLWQNKSNNQQSVDSKQRQMVGNDRDEHGCIGSAGYTWCEEKQKCLRSWEEECVSN